MKEILVGIVPILFYSDFFQTCKRQLYSDNAENMEFYSTDFA